MNLTTPKPFDRRTIPQDAEELSWSAPDGWSLRQMEWPVEEPSRGSVLFMTGRADFYEKYLETFHNYREQGWNVTSVDWRGQGLSGRCAADRHVGHISDFSIWVDDLAHFFADWQASHPGPHVVIGHSMGGHLVMRTLVEQRINPDAVILSAPMLAPAGGGTPAWAAQLSAKFMCLFGKSEQAAWKPVENPLDPEETRQRLLTHDVIRYADEFFWFRDRPDVRLGPASWRWVERAYASARTLQKHPIKLHKVKTPLLFLATSADELVDNAVIEFAHQLLPNSELKLFGEECGHEIYREEDKVRDEALRASFAFLDKVAPKGMIETP